MQHRRMASLELIQKHIRTRDLLGLVEKLATLLVKGHANDKQLKALFNYLLRSGDTDRFDEFIHAVTKRLPKHKERMMTIAERLRQEGHQRGLENGLKKGIKKGLRLGKREEAQRIARTMLADGIDRRTVSRITGLSAAEVMRLSH